MGTTPPIRSLAPEEGSFEIPLWGVPFVLVILWVCLFSGLGAIGLVGPDEPRYAAIARAMAETHDWITPRLWGTPWFEKPVLYYWTAGLAMRFFGVSEFAARLPSALAGLLAVAAAAGAALRSYGLGAAWYTLLMLPTSVAVIGFSRAAGPDMLFAAFLTATMAVAVEMLQKDKPGPTLQLAFGFFLGAAVLAKGPAAVILAGGATLVWAALSRQWLAPFRFLHPVVIAAFCATALPWYVMCALRNPDFLRVFIWQHNFERYTTPVFEHRQPVWYYSYILALAVSPWIIVLVAILVAWIRRLRTRPGAENAAVFYACWSLFPILFFSLSQSKLPGYILPAIPPLFILFGRWVSLALAEQSKALFRVMGWTGSLLLFVSIPLLALRVIVAEPVKPAYVDPVIFMVLVFGIVVVSFAVKRRLAGSFATLVLLIIALVGIADFVVLPQLDPEISSRQYAKEILEIDPTGERVRTVALPRNTEYGIEFYLNRTLPEWEPVQRNLLSAFIYGRSADDLRAQLQLRADSLLCVTAFGPSLCPVISDHRSF